MDIREKTKKRLKIQSWRRGMKEVDLILGGFIDDFVHLLSDAEIDCYERLLLQDDQIIFGWISKKYSPPDEFHFIIEKIYQSVVLKSKLN